MKSSRRVMQVEGEERCTCGCSLTEGRGAAATNAQGDGKQNKHVAAQGPALSPSSRRRVNSKKT